MQGRKYALVLVCSLKAVQCLLAQEKIMNDYRNMTLFAMTEVELPAIPANTFTITDFGAICNGQALNTNAIQQAI